MRRALLWTLLAVFMPLAAHGAISVDKTVFKDQGAATSIATAAFSTSSTNELLLAFVSSDATSSGTNVVVNSVTGGGLTWTLVRRTNAQRGTAEIWRAFASSIVTNITVTAALSQRQAASMTVIAFAGVDTSGSNGSGAIGASASGSSSKGAPTASLVTTRANSWVFGVGTDWDKATARTAGPNQSLVHQYLASVGDTYWVQQMNAPTPAAGTTVTINDTAPTADQFNLTICEILAASAPTTFSLSGTVTPLALGAGVSIAISGPSGTLNTTTSGTGAYSVNGLANGTYSITPTKANATFSPTARLVTVSGANSTGNDFSVNTYSISGVVTGGAGATVALSGASSASTTADASGNFSFSGLLNGDYTVTPSKAGFSFSPANQAVTISGANVANVDFSSLFSISGTITNGAGATVTLSGDASAVVSADGSGNFTIPGLAAGNYTLTPTKANVTFSPLNKSVTITTSGVTGVNFAAVTYTISGVITGGGGASVALSGAATASTTADGSGNFSFGGLLNGSYTVTPSKSGFAFSPPNRPVTLSSANASNVDFNALFSISGAITNGSGATVTLSGDSSAVVSADGRGNYNFPGLVAGNYTITPTKTDVTFTPLSRTVNVTTSGPTDVNFDAVTYTISGTIAGSSGATVTLTGDASASTTADGSGKFSFSGLLNGSYTVTPSKLGLTFSPVNRAVSVSGADVTGVNFNTLFSISGTITNGGSATVTLSGDASAVITADGTGNYSFPGIAPGSYTVTPAKANVTFTPLSKDVAVTTASVTTLNFAAVTYTISGTVSGPSGATVALSGAATATTTADASGNYSFSGLFNGNYVVTPSKSGFVFGPGNQPVTVSSANVPGIDFTAPTYSISGTISGGSGIGLTLSGAASATTTIDGSGNYSFNGLGNGDYTITPAGGGYSFSPANHTASINSADVAGMDFTAAIVSTLSIDSTAFGDRTSNATTVVTSSFSTTGPNELLLALVSADMPTSSGTNNSITNVTGGGLTWTLVRRTNTQRGTAEIWRSFAAAQLTNVTVTATLATSATSTITVMSFKGVNTGGTNGSGAIGATGSGNGTTGSPTASLVTTGNNSLVVGVGEDWNAGTVATVGAGQTLIHQMAVSNVILLWTQRQTATTPLSGTTVTINDTAPVNHVYNMTIAEVLGAAGGVPPATYTMSGTITPITGGAGATVALTGAATASTVTSGTGTYSFTNLANGTYTLTPSNTGYSFSPNSQTITVNGANVVAPNFTASPAAQTYSISGTVTSTGSGAVITLGGAASGTTTASGTGAFTFSGLSSGDYTVTPSKAGVVFTPTNRSVTITSSSATGVNFTAATFQSNLTINGSQQFQTMDGTGVNINVNSWNNGELAPALDQLIDTNGSTVFRVIRDPMTWVSSESLITPLHNLDSATLDQVYGASAGEMQELWNTIAYLNQRGIVGNQIILNFMGWTPAWIGGSGSFGNPSHITAGKESEFATMVASLVYYGKQVKHLDFNLLAPLNEEDLSNCIEGPCVATTQYITILRALITELDAMGLSSVKLVAPDSVVSTSSYIAAVLGDSTVSARTAHLGSHNYGGSTNPDSRKSHWLTETGASCPSCDTGGTPSQGEWAFARDTTNYVLQDIANGFNSVMVYDAYDSFYFHHNSMGYWGLLAYDQVAGTYSPRKRFYTNAQVNAFVPPGSVRIGISESISGLGPVVAFYSSTTGKITMVGQNTGSSSITINGQLLNLPSVTSFAVYTTNTSVDMQRGADVPVTSGTFSVTIPGNSFFSLTN